VMAPLHTQQCPAVTFEGFRQLSAGDRLHTAISRIRSPSATLAGATFTDKQPSTAS
jgi:hypothetical protein